MRLRGDVLMGNSQRSQVGERDSQPSASVRYRPRIDATQRGIVEALRKAGCSVYSLAGVGSGCPDLLVGCSGKTILLECKSPRALRKDGTLNARDKASAERQDAWRVRWLGEQPRQVSTPLEALLACSLTGAQ